MGYIVFGDDERMNEVRKLFLLKRTDKSFQIYPPNKKLLNDDIKKAFGGTVVFAGNIDREAMEFAKQKNITVELYNNAQSFAKYNAQLTAECTLMLILSKIKNQINENKILVIGYGKCGGAIVDYLEALSCDYTIMTSRPDRADIYGKAVGYESDISLYDIIINTAPCKVISDDKVKTVKRGAIILDIASKPYGLDHELARRLGIDSDVYPALPAKYRPQSGANAIYKRVLGEFDD